MKTIVVIVAMDKELLTFKSYLENCSEEKIESRTIYIGNISSKRIILTKTGIGKVSAATILTMLIERYNPDLVINMGIAGGYKKSLNTLDTILVTKAVYSDADMTTDEFSNLSYGQLEEMPPYFEIAKELEDSLDNVIPNDVIKGMIASGDQFVVSHEKCENLVNTHFPNYDILGFDMESTAVYHVCYLYNKPCLVLRTISDIIGSTTPLDYNKFSQLASDKVGTICKNIIEKMQ